MNDDELFKSENYNVIMFQNGKKVPDGDLATTSNKRTLFVFGGNNVNQDAQVEALEKVISPFIAQDRENYDIVTVGYPKEILDFDDKYKEYRVKNRDNMYGYLYLAIFPDIINNDAVSKQEIINDLRHKTFFGHYAGSSVINGIVNELKTDLVKQNYNNEDIKDILKEFRAVSHSPFNLLDSDITSINICPLCENSTTVKWPQAMKAYSNYSSSADLPKYFQYFPSICSILQDALNKENKPFIFINEEKENTHCFVCDKFTEHSVEKGDHSPKVLGFALDNNESKHKLYPSAVIATTMVKDFINAPTSTNISLFTKNMIEYVSNEPIKEN